MLEGKNEDRKDILLGPRAREVIEKGESPLDRQSARQTVNELSTEARERLRQEVESELTPKQKIIVEELRSAKNSEERVKLFAAVADEIGLDPLLSLIPELGDGASSIVSGLYLLMEAREAGMGPAAYLKIIGLQAADLAVGALPVLGDVADYFFKANKWSAKSFEEQTREIIEKARAAEVPEEEIQKLLQGAEKWPRLATKAVSVAGRALNPV